MRKGTERAAEQPSPAILARPNRGSDASPPTQGREGPLRAMTRRRTRRSKSTAEVLDRLLTELYAGAPGEDDLAKVRPEPEPTVAAPSGGEGRLTGKALRAARALLGQLKRWRPEDERAVAQLLAEPVSERWRRVATDCRIQRPEVIELLLSAANERGAGLRSADAEETGLLALHLCERLDPDAYPEGLVGDLLCRALATRVEHLIAHRRLRAAELACLRTRDLLLESSDPLVAQDVGLASALLHWAQGDREEALALLNGLGRLAAVLGEVGRVGELALWCCMLFVELGDREAAAGLEAQAEDVLSASAVKKGWARVRAKHKALHLAEAPSHPPGGAPTVH